MASVAVDLFMRFCINTNLDYRQMRDSVRKYLLAYQRNILHRGAFTALFGEAFMNWDYIERNLPRLDCTHWIAIFKFIDFSKVPRTNKSALQSIDRYLSLLKLDGLDIACQVFLLKNTNFITAQLGVERLLCEHEVDDAYSKSLQFFALSADSAFDVTEMTAVFCHIMQECTVNEAELERQIQFVNLREEELASSFKMKQIRMVGGRPRLRSKLAAIKQESVSAVMKKDDLHKTIIERHDKCVYGLILGFVILLLLLGVVREMTRAELNLVAIDLVGVKNKQVDLEQKQSFMDEEQQRIKYRIKQLEDGDVNRLPQIAPPPPSTLPAHAPRNEPTLLDEFMEGCFALYSYAVSFVHSFCVVFGYFSAVMAVILTIGFTRLARAKARRLNRIKTN